jgi:hypothetical protein
MKLFDRFPSMSLSEELPKEDKQTRWIAVRDDVNVEACERYFVMDFGRVGADRNLTVKPLITLPLLLPTMMPVHLHLAKATVLFCL